MNLKFLFSLLLLLAIVAFSVQNAGVVQLQFLAWKFSASQALVIFVSACLGVVIGAVVPVLVRRQRAEPPSHPGSLPPPG